MSVASLTPRIREALGLSASYDAETIPAAIGRACQKLLRDYNFPKALTLFQYKMLTAGKETFTLPQGMKTVQALQLFDPVEVTWSDPLQRRAGFTRPQGSGEYCNRYDWQQSDRIRVPMQWWQVGNTIQLDTPIPAEGAGLSLQLYYLSMDADVQSDWMVEDYEDVVFNLTCYRMAVEQRKPDVTGAFQGLWSEDQQSLAKYANELEFEGLEFLQHAARDVTGRYGSLGSWVA